jgi:hypothetical protein
MGFEVHVLVTLKAVPNEKLMTELDHHFELARHDVGTKTVNVTEHVSMSDEADAIEFVRALVLEVVPDGSVITKVTTTPG